MNRFYMAVLLTAILLCGSPASFAAEAEPVQKEKAASRDANPKIEPGAYASMMRLFTAMAIIRTHYVDKDKVTYEKLFHSALNGMIRDLDPFSSLEDKEFMKSFTKERKAAGMIGVTLSSRTKGLEVVSVVWHGPADRAGIKAGDIITEINDTPVEDLRFDDCVAKIRGTPGSELILKIYRLSNDSTMNIRIKRESIAPSAIIGTRIIEPDAKIGYLRIVQFEKTTAADLDKELALLHKDGVKALIIDLRNDPGGLLDSAVQVCSRFLPEGAPVVSIEGRLRKDKINALKCKKYLDLPLAVLVNENTASSSEIFAGTMQDSHRAVLIGEKTFGKGSVQTVLPFGEKETLRLTTAKYYTPSHKVIHEVGITPDIMVSLPGSHRLILARQLAVHPGEIKPTAIGMIRDLQLERAVEVLKGAQILKDISLKNKQPEDKKENK